MTNPASEYTPAFYTQDVDASMRTTAATLPELFRFTTRGCIVDFGTELGYWLEAAGAVDITDVNGYDGDDVQPDQLRIPREQFTAVDLNQREDTGRSFDRRTVSAWPLRRAPSNRRAAGRSGHPWTS